MARNAANDQLGPGSRDRQARMRAMTDAAVALFSEEGYAAVSTRRIAERAGCSETLLFRYFGDKRGLLLAITNQLRDGAVERKGAQDFHDAREFIEHFLVESLRNFRRIAPTLKVVIAALINDTDMTADFEERHEESVRYIADGLRWFQDSGGIAADIDVDALSQAIEQLSFSLGFVLQLVFGRSEGELADIARAAANVLGRGVQAEAPQPLLAPQRRKAMAAVLDARTRLDQVVELLEEEAAAPVAVRRPKGGRASA